MSKRSDLPRVFVIDGDNASFADADTIRALTDRGLLCGPRSELSSGQDFGQSFRSENVSGQKSGGFPHAAHAEILRRGDSVPGYDPNRVHREFPDRWQAYIRANFRNLAHIGKVFGVSERTARKWWNGETGANGGHVAIAVNEHPVAAPRMLFEAG